MRNAMVDIMADVMSNRADKEERKKKLHDLLDRYHDDVRALDGDPGLDGIDFMFAKPYLEEVLEERRAKKERVSVMYEKKRDAGEEFREDIKKRRRDDDVEEVLANKEFEIANKYFQKKHWDLLGMLESRNRYNISNTKGGGIGALGKYQMRKDILIDLGYVNKEGKWTGKNGLYSSDDFLELPEVQETIAKKMVNNYYRQLKNYFDKAGTEISGKECDFKVTERGMIAAAHRMGQKYVKSYLKLLEKNKDGKYYFPYSKIGKYERAKYEAVETRLRLFAE